MTGCRERGNLWPKSNVEPVWRKERPFTFNLFNLSLAEEEEEEIQIALRNERESS